MALPLPAQFASQKVTKSHDWSFSRLANRHEPLVLWHGWEDLIRAWRKRFGFSSAVIYPTIALFGEKLGVPIPPFAAIALEYYIC
jgi:hypothetical protein